MIMSKTNNQQEIYSVMARLKNSIYSSIVRNDFFLIELSKKFSKYAEFYCLKQEDEPIGYIAFYDNNQETKVAFLSMITVSKEYQGQGLGNRLLNKMIEVCRIKGMNSITLEVDKTNENAIVFYEKHGFSKISKESNISFFYSMRI